MFSQSHRLEENPEEQARITALGARLGRARNSRGTEAGPMRAWPGGLAVTRGVGDADCGSIVTPEPSYSRCHAPPSGGAIVACTDGVWDKLSTEEVTHVPQQLCITAETPDHRTILNPGRRNSSHRQV